MRTVEEIKAEMHGIGEIIDDRSMNHIPFYPYVQEYEKLKKELQEAITIENGAAIAHSQWSGWMKYLFTKCADNCDGTATIPKWAVDRWKRQMETEYADLPPEEKASDRKEAQRYIDFLTRDEAEKALGKEQA